MAKDTLRSCRWNQTVSDCNKESTSAATVTSSLWKQLTEESDLRNIPIPSFPPSLSSTDDKSFSIEEDTASVNLLPLSQLPELWEAPQNVSRNMKPDISQMIPRSPWDPLANLSHLSCDIPDYLVSSSPGCTLKQPGTSISCVSSKGNEENISPSFNRVIGSCKDEPGIRTDNQIDRLSKNQLFLSQQSLADSTWDTGAKTPNSCFPVCSVGTDIYGHHKSESYSPTVPSVPQRQVLRDIGNISQPLAVPSQKMYHPLGFQTSSDSVPSPEPFRPYGVSSFSSFSSPETTVASPQRQQTDLVALMHELSMLSESRETGNPFAGNMPQTYSQQKTIVASTAVTQPNKGCVFCKNNNYHSTFYRSHTLKDERGHCQCPVLRMYVCPLCSATGDSAHTLKYCPRNTVTHGDPISAGLPPGKVTNWREVANKMFGRYNTNY